MNTDNCSEPPADGDGQIVTPVWIRISGATKLTSIGRSRLYQLIAERKIRSRVLKRHRDSQRGIRLISYDSLLSYIESDQANGGPR